MKLIDERTRVDLIDGFVKLVEVFNDTDACFDKISPPHMPAKHYKFIVTLINGDIVSLDDARLYELCKEFDRAFVAGDCGYTAEKNRAINNLVDLVQGVIK